MTVSEYVRRLLSRWRVIAAVTVLMTVAAWVITMLSPQVYVSQAQLYVTTLSDKTASYDVDRTLYVQGRMQTYAALAESAEMADLVVEELGLADRPAEVASRVQTEVPYATVLINLRVSAGSAQDAQDIAASVIDNYDELMQQLEDQPGLTLGIATVDPPTRPATPASPLPLLNLLSGLLTGLILGVGVAAVRDVLDTRLRPLDRIDAPVLGALPAVRATDADLAESATTPLAEAVRRLAVAVTAGPHRSFLLTAPREADAAPTVAVLLGRALARSGRDVLLVDADLRRPRIADMLGLGSDAGLTSVLQGSGDLAEARVDTDTGLRVLPAGPRTDTPHELVASTAMTDLIARAAAEHEVVIVVAPAALELADAAALAPAVDDVLLLARVDRTRHRDLQAALTELDRDERSNVEFVLTHSPALA